jgi:AGZA family xanthine/uracil permease-like MFS transporter
VALPDFSTFGAGLDVSVFWRVGFLAAVMAIFSIMLADFFDTMGTVIGIAGEAGWLDAKGKLPRLNRILLIDSLSAVFGGFSSASSATTYIESAAGVSEGGRTGLTSVVTALCFFLALFFSPLAGVVPPQATAAALILVGFLMCSIVKDIPFGDFEEGFPALMTLVVMPFSYSITNGIGAGFITYVFIKFVRGKGREVHGMLLWTAVAFAVYFALPWLRFVFKF